MYRLGFYTGKIYDSDLDTGTIDECCMVLNCKDLPEDDDPYIIRERARLKKKCKGCFACPMSVRNLLEPKNS